MKRETGIRVMFLAAVLLGLLATVPAAGAAVSHRFDDPGPQSIRGFWNHGKVTEALRRDPAFGTSGARSSLARTHHRPVRVSRPEVGKILGWDRYGGYSCTGSVLDTPSLRLVLTAGHCVLADGVWSRKMLFLPDFRNGRRPYGAWPVKTAWVSNYWQRFSYGTYGSNFDIAILVTRKSGNGTRVGEHTGAIPYEAYPDRRGLTDIYGYPAGAMGGRVMRTCRNFTRPDFYDGRWFPGPTGLLTRCNMAAGSSGGPWVSRYENQDGSTTGVIDGLTSTGYSLGGRSYLTSPYFGRIIVRLIKATEGR